MENLSEKIAQNYRQISEQVEIARLKHRNPLDKVKIVVVSKRKPLEVIQAAIACGIHDFGENYPEEAAEKISHFSGQKLTWHMIGHIQSRKAPLVASNFQLVHSIDTFRIADKLSQNCKQFHVDLPVLLECNMSGEESKFGISAYQRESWEHVVAQVAEIAILKQIKLVGLMTMPPWSEDPEASRPYFALLRELKDHLNLQLPGLNLSELSMGTSTDYLAGVKEGATLLRIGTAILGSRVY